MKPLSEGRASRDSKRLQFTPSPAARGLVQRKSACVCGGGCPHCQGQATKGHEQTLSQLTGEPVKETVAPAAGPQTIAGEQAPKSNGTADAPAAVPAASTGCPPVPAPGFKAVVTPRDNFSGRSLSHAGIGETFKLSFESSVSMDPNFFGGLRWLNFGDGEFSADPTNGTATWTAPETAQRVLLSLRAGTSQQCTMYDVHIDVVEPTGVESYVLAKIKPTSGHWGCGVLLVPIVLPKTVSFRAIWIREGEATVKGSGWLAFKTGQHHCEGSGAGEFAGTNKCVFLPVDKIDPNGGATSGCDKATDGGNSQEENPPKGTKLKEDEGEATWDIPLEYKFGEEGPSKPMGIAKNVFTSEKGGNATISKAGSPPQTCGKDDPRTEKWDFSRCPKLTK